MPPPALHIGVTGRPGSRPAGCIPAHAEAPGQAGGTPKRGQVPERGARLGRCPGPMGTPRSASASQSRGRPRGTPGRGGSQRRPEDFPAQRWEIQPWVPRPVPWQPGRAGWAHRDLGPALCLSASSLSSVFWASHITDTPHSRFHPTASPEAGPAPRVPPAHGRAHPHQLWGGTFAPAAPAWLQLKLPGNGGQYIRGEGCPVCSSRYHLHCLSVIAREGLQPG